MRLTLNRWRARSQFRRQRHEALLTTLLGSSLSVPTQNRLITSGDAFKAALRLLIDTTTSVEDRSVLIGAIRGLSLTPSLQ
jgi:hypothetical protein